MAAPKTSKPKTHADRLTQAGVEAKRSYDVVLMDPADLHLERRPGYSNFDPRVNDPVDVADPVYQSILANGVQQPVQAREDGERNGKPIMTVVVGRGRVQKLIHINKHHPLPSGPRRLKVVLVKGSDGEMVLLNLASNIGKPESPYSLAVKIGMAEKLGMDLAAIARACGWSSVAPVKLYMPILNFPAEVQQAFHGPDALPLSSVKFFARVPHEERVSVLEKVRAGGAKKTREVAAAVEASTNGHAYVAPTPKKRIWKAERVEALVGAISAQKGEAAAAAILRHILGEADALADFPVLQEAVAKVAATP